jgi:hypothetical protein
VDVMLHVNNGDGFTIAVSENRQLARIAQAPCSANSPPRVRVLSAPPQVQLHANGLLIGISEGCLCDSLRLPAPMRITTESSDDEQHGSRQPAICMGSLGEPKVTADGRDCRPRPPQEIRVPASYRHVEIKSRKSSILRSRLGGREPSAS